MNVAPSRTHIKRRIDEYIWRDESLPLTRLRHTLEETFLPLGQVAILGGLIRDIARGGVKAFKSDVDLVIAASPSQVQLLAGKLRATPNRFGGFSILTAQWKIDFWALRNTWAHKAGHVRIISMRDVIKCTFFTYDAIAYDIAERRLYAHEHYVADLLSRRLEINLEPNPSLDGNMVRTIRRMLGHDLSAGPTLKRFIGAHLTPSMYDHVIIIEKKLHGFSFAELYDDSEELKEALLNPVRRRPAASTAQLVLPMRL